MGGGRSDHAFGGQHVVVARRAPNRAVAPRPLRPLRRQVHVRRPALRPDGAVRLPANTNLSCSTGHCSARRAAAPASSTGTCSWCSRPWLPRSDGRADAVSQRPARHHAGTRAKSALRTRVGRGRHAKAGAARRGAGCYRSTFAKPNGQVAVPTTLFWVLSPSPKPGGHAWANKGQNSKLPNSALRGAHPYHGCAMEIGASSPLVLSIC